MNLKKFLVVVPKNIRDEDGIWHPVETYVQKRTEAQFSHGLCPACIQKLYAYLKG